MPVLDESSLHHTDDDAIELLLPRNVFREHPYYIAREYLLFYPDDVGHLRDTGS